MINMRALPPPRANWSIIFVFLLGFILVLSSLRYQISRDFVILVGLLLDVIGAGMLVIPDVPILNYYFKSGRLRKAHETMTYETPGRLLVDPIFFKLDQQNRLDDIPDRLKDITGNFIGHPICHHEGFYEAVDVFREWEIDRDKEIRVWKYIIAFIPTGFFTLESYDKNYIDIWIDVDEPHQEIDSDEPHASIMKLDFPKEIEERIDDFETRFRRSGLLILISGFVYQGVAILLL